MWTTETKHTLQWTTKKQIDFWHSIIFIFLSLGVVTTHGLPLTPNTTTISWGHDSWALSNSQQNNKCSTLYWLLVAIIPPIEGRVEEGDTYVYIYIYVHFCHFFSSFTDLGWQQNLRERIFFCYCSRWKYK